MLNFFPGFSDWLTVEDDLFSFCIEFVVENFFLQDLIKSDLIND